MTKAEEVDLDSVLAEIGQLGRFQIMTVILVILPVMFSAFMAGEYIFTADSSGYRCYIAECEALRTDVYEPSWLPFAIPTNDGMIDQCHRYPVLPGAVQADGQCTAEMFEKNTTVPCVQYVYAAGTSVVSDFGIQCQEWKRVLIGTFNSIGTLLVLPITGYVSDRYGRRLALTLNAANTAILGTLRSFSVNYEMYLVLNLLGTTLGDGAFSAGYILATELVGPKWRTMVGVLMNSFFGVGQVVLGFIAWAIPQWRVLILTLYVPQLFVLAYGWIMYESVRWLLSKEYYDRATEVLRNAARINKRNLSPQTVEKLVENTKNKIRVAQIHQIENQQSREPSLVTKIVKSRVMLRRMCIIPVWWITVTLVYYGMSINAVSLAGNRYLNYILVCAVEIPGYWLAYKLLDRMGRKSTLSMSFFICAICSIIFPFVSSDLFWLSMSLYMIGKLTISIVFSTVYIYTAELLPTSSRHSLLAFASMLGRIGAICAPLTPALRIYWHGIPSLIFGSMAFISGCLAFTTPDTLNIRLPDTIEDAERIGR